MKRRNGFVSWSTAIIMVLTLVIGLVATPIRAEAATTKYAAGFYLLKSGCSRPTGSKSQPSENYISVGSGKIYSRTNISDDDAAVAANIAKAPDCSAYLADDEMVVWYSCKKIYGTTYHVDGEIVKNPNAEEPKVEDVQPVVETPSKEIIVNVDVAPEVKIEVEVEQSVEAAPTPVVEAVKSEPVAEAAPAPVVEVVKVEPVLETAPALVVEDVKSEPAVEETTAPAAEALAAADVTLSWNSKLGVNRLGVIEYNETTYKTWLMSDAIAIETGYTYSYESTYNHTSKPTVVVYFYNGDKYLGNSGTLSNCKTSAAINISVMDGATTMRIALTNVPDSIKNGIANGFIFHKNVGDSKVVAAPETEPEPVQQAPVAQQAPARVSAVASAPTPEAVAPKYSSLKEELADMLENGDTSVHDISQYGYSVGNVSTIFDEVIEEHYLAFCATEGAFIGVTKDDNKKVLTVWINQIPDDFATIYAGVKQFKTEMDKVIQPGMTDLDKALALHDLLVKKVEYKNYGAVVHTGYAAMGYGYANCNGYKDAYQKMLHMVGINATYVIGNSSSHSWAVVEIDGQYYHVDPTWDDTRSQVSGQVSHQFFLYSEAAFLLVNGTYHSVDKTLVGTTTSTKYDDWFVHDIVGDMTYVDGFWYYYDNNGTYMRAKLDGSVIEVVQ